MRRLLLAILIFACPAAAQDGDLAIDARRLDVMVDQSDAALHTISPEWPLAPPVADDEGDAKTALVSAVRRFALMQAQACRAKLMGPRFCATLYDPPWLNTGPSDLRAAIDEASARISAFWTAACERAKDPNLCAME